MPVGDLSTRAAIEVDGNPLSDQIRPDVERVVIDDHLHLLDTFEITVRDADRGVLGRAGFAIGAQVKIAATAQGSQAPTPLMSGEITSLEAVYDQSASKIVVRGYDKAHRLTRGRRTETYRNVKYSDIATTIAGRSSLGTGTIDDSRAVFDHVAQANESDLDFLRRLASEIGFEVAVLDGKLDFRQPTPSSSAPAGGTYSSSNPLQLVLGQNLLEFRPRITSAGQVADVKARGWDVANKQALVGSAPGGTTSAALPDSPAALAAKFGNPSHVVVGRAFGSRAEVDDAAKAFAEAIGSTFAEATGVARGNPDLRAGAAVSISVVADPFAGRYTLTHTRHVFDDEVGYRTQFVVSGRQDRTLLGLASAGGGSAGSTIPGVVVGIVTDATDPDHLGRVKLKFPWLDDDFEANWARVGMPGAGKDRGLVWLPEVNDEVLVAFEHGDIRRPYVVGGLWNGVDTVPDLPVHDGERKARALVSKLGSKVVFEDEDGKAGILIVTAGGQYEIHLDEGGSQVNIKAAGGKVHIEAQQDIELQATGKVTVEGQQGLELKSTGIVKVQGAQVQLG